MSARKSKNAGWAAYNLEQQRTKGIKSEAGSEPYPPISSTGSSHHPRFTKNNDIKARPFSSVLLPSVNFQTLGDIKDIRSGLIGTSSTNKVISEKCSNNVSRLYEKLKELHPWADNSLIEDIMEVVDNDIDKASDLLKEMVSSQSVKENKKTEILDYKYNTENFYSENNAFMDNMGLSLRETQNLVGISYAHEDNLVFENKEMTGDHAASEKGHPDHSTPELHVLHRTGIPVEPEWEEDDIYLIHRKDAMRMMRSASRHSKAATESYLRGDHVSAQQYSIKAKEQWKTAERFNAMAAKEILKKRNCENDVWKLDLHGLHAREAVEALKEHLHKIESQVSPSPNIVNSTNMIRSLSLNSLSMDKEKWDKQKVAYKPRSTVLEVITGKGLHSRGQAALPSAIEGFLSENGYYYDKARPGMIAVRPKFRHQ